LLLIYEFIGVGNRTAARLFTSIEDKVIC
jgi:hypothetical protein